MTIGGIRTRWLDDGRVELGSMDADAESSHLKYASCPRNAVRGLAPQRRHRGDEGARTGVAKAEGNPLACGRGFATGDVVLIVLSFALATD